MTCSTCKEAGHNRRSCVMNVKCTKCGKFGHTHGKCSFNVIYKSVTCLPKEIINIIHIMKSDMEVNDKYHSYFSNVVCKEIRDFGGFWGKKRFHSFGARIIFENKIRNYLLDVQNQTIKKDRIVIVKKLYDYIYDLNWLFKAYNNTCIKNFMNSVIVKIEQIFLDGFHNIWMYRTMFD